MGEAVGAGSADAVGGDEGVEEPIVMKLFGKATLTSLAKTCG